MGYAMVIGTVLAMGATAKELTPMIGYGWSLGVTVPLALGTVVFLESDWACQNMWDLKGFVIIILGLFGYLAWKMVTFVFHLFSG